jgi:hypothetical protein
MLSSIKRRIKTVISRSKKTPYPARWYEASKEDDLEEWEAAGKPHELILYSEQDGVIALEDPGHGTIILFSLLKRDFEIAYLFHNPCKIEAYGFQYEVTNEQIILKSV